ncbi:MAG: hypothetical protein KAQ68_00870 [Clostridiales bacterium]|nr:hypothetical protein [Clostridiales bacterium]
MFRRTLRASYAISRKRDFSKCTNTHGHEFLINRKILGLNSFHSSRKESVDFLYFWYILSKIVQKVTAQ